MQKIPGREGEQKFMKGLWSKDEAVKKKG